MKKALFVGFIMVLLLAPGVMAYSRCDNSTLITETNLTRTINGVVTNYTFEVPQICPYGCEDNLTKSGADCIEADYIVTTEVIIIVIVIVGFFAWLAGRKG